MTKKKLGLILGLSLCLFAGAASAVFVGRGEYAVYYRDGVVVGSESRDCDNNLSQWGQVTADYEKGQWFCEF
ncbi:MAG: DUF6289 family protein [Lysobacter sp.]